MGKLGSAAMKAIPAFLLIAVSALAQTTSEETFRVDVKLVRLVATVKTAEGKPIGDLKREDLAVTDNGAPQQIALFERTTAQPLSVAILIDISGSTAGKMKEQTSAVGRFVTALFREGNPDDRAALWSFNWVVSQDVAWTKNPRKFADQLKKLKAEAGTSLYDAIYLGAGDLTRREGRHVMIVVSDGGNTTSAKDFHVALEAAHNADAVIYPVLTVPITNEAGRNVGGEHALATLAQTTGGKVFAPGIESIDQAFAEILRDLRTQYLIGYYPKDVPLTRNRFHTVQIRPKDSALQVIARTGYYG
ncbi:MAG: VWA domain-containing protein, partial [Bryobacteraceae bacterium]|nr:VWA domain-containing protein [Bryobacteraceae bacterium]